MMGAAMLSAVFRMDHTGSFDVDFDYDGRPDWDIGPDPGSYLADLEKYPRDPELIPSWMPRPE